MTRQEFLKKYLSALQKAMDNDKINHGFLVKDPSWYYGDDSSELEITEEKNYQEFASLFDLVLKYFDALSHYQEFTDNVPVSKYRAEILEKIEYYTKSLKDV